MQRLLQVSLVTAVATALCIVTIDEPLARWLATRDTWPAFWNTTTEVLEYAFGMEPWKWISVTVLVAGALATLFVPRLRPHAHPVVLVMLSHLLARNASWTTKWLTGRLRPTEWLEQGGDTFWRDGGFSFPSGHVLWFASIVLPVVLLHPRARPLLAIVAFVMIARVAVNAHFVSDVLGGLAVTAALTWLAARLVQRVLPLPSRPASPQ